MASSGGCEFNLFEIYYGFRGESTINCGYLYSQISGMFADTEKFPARHFWQILTLSAIDSVLKREHRRARWRRQISNSVYRFGVIPITLAPDTEEA